MPTKTAVFKSTIGRTRANIPFDASKRIAFLKALWADLGYEKAGFSAPGFLKVTHKRAMVPVTDTKLKYTVDLTVLELTSFVDAKDLRSYVQACKTGGLVRMNAKSYQGIATAQGILTKRFGKRFKLVCRYPNGIFEIQDTQTGVTITKTRLDIQHQTSIEYFLTGERASTTEASHCAKTQSKLDEWGLASAFTVVGNSDGTLAIKHRRGVFKMQGAYLAYQCSRDLFIRTAIGHLKWGLNKPVKYTDASWNSYVETRTAGRITGAGFIPPECLPSAGMTYKCLRCSAKFTSMRGATFSSKSTYLKCPNCDRRQSRTYSKAAIEWLTWVEKVTRCKLQTAESKAGEFKVNLGKRHIYVDGYHKKTRTIFEYHGSRWHGNPMLYYAHECPNPFNRVKSYQLLQRTIQNELDLVKAGYNIVRIWDQDFLNPERFTKWKNRELPRLMNLVRPRN